MYVIVYPKWDIDIIIAMSEHKLVPEKVIICTYNSRHNYFTIRIINVKILFNDTKIYNYSCFKFDYLYALYIS